MLFGLVSTQKASKTAFLLNSLPGMDFERTEDLKLPDFNPKSEISFSRFFFQDEENHLDFSLLANKEHGMMLFPDLRQFDYLLIVRGGLEFFDAAQFAKSCMRIQGLQLVAPIEQEKIKSKISWNI